MPETPPELRGVDRFEQAEPRRPRPIVTIVTWLCILGLLLSLGAGLFSGI